MNLSSTHWHAEDLWLSIRPLLPSVSIEILPEIDSTNTELIRRARLGQVEPIVLIAESQTAGRGRQGRTWQNHPGDCLMYSLGLALNPVSWSGLSLVVGLSIAQSLQSHVPDNAPKIGVKWPNDLWFADGRKLGGTLIETANLLNESGTKAFGAGSGAARFVIIGTGINVRPPQATASAFTTPAACLQELSMPYSAPQALHDFLPRLIDDILLFANQGFAAFHSRFTTLDILRGKEVHLSDGSNGRALGVTMEGLLQLLTTDGNIRNVISGDVSVRPTHMALPPSDASI